MNLRALALDLNKANGSITLALKVLAGSRQEERLQGRWLRLTAEGVTGPSGFAALERQEHQLLALLIEHRGVPLTPETILSRVWGPYFIHDTARLTGSLALLRRLLAIAGLPSGCVEEVRGVGYMLLAVVDVVETPPKG
jgi:DNA-binding response OmpR family regulator